MFFELKSLQWNIYPLSFEQNFRSAQMVIGRVSHDRWHWEQESIVLKGLQSLRRREFRQSTVDNPVVVERVSADHADDKTVPR